MKRCCVMVVLTFLVCALHATAALAYVPGRDGPWSEAEYRRHCRGEKNVSESYRVEYERRNRSRYYSPVPTAAEQQAARQEALKNALTRLVAGTGTPADRDLVSRWKNERKAGPVGASFGSTPSIPPTRVPVLVQDRQSRDEAVRHRAAYQLRFAGTAAKEAVPGLLQALEDSDADVRWVAAGSLGAVGSGSPEVARALTNALRDPAPQVRGAATEALRHVLP
jgi:hypothetical protein